MSTCIHPFDTSVKELCNIYIEETCSEKTNINKYYEIRTEFMLEFQRSLPKGFDYRLFSRVIAIVKGKRTKKKDEIVKMYNIKNIFLIMNLHLFQFIFLKTLENPGSQN